MTKYFVELSSKEKERLANLVKKGKSLARDILRARILLNSSKDELIG